MRLAPGVENAVAAEVPVVRHVAEIPAVFEGTGNGERGTGNRNSQPLVGEIPDEATLVGRILLHKIPMALQRAAACVAHRVSVFALNQWNGRIVRNVVLAPLGGVVHWRHDVRIRLGVRS